MMVDGMMWMKSFEKEGVSWAARGSLTAVDAGCRRLEGASVLVPQGNSRFLINVVFCAEKVSQGRRLRRGLAGAWSMDGMEMALAAALVKASCWHSGP